MQPKRNELNYTYIYKKEMANHSRILAWKIPWTEEPMGNRVVLQSMGLQSWA